MQSTRICLLASAVFAAATLIGASESLADPCSASSSSLVSRTAGGTCSDGLVLNQTLTLQYRVTNVSIVDDPGGSNDGVGVNAKMVAGKLLTATLAQATGGVGGTALPGTLQFVPVCSAGSTGGALSAGDACNAAGPAAANCGTGVCGCVSNLAGVTCTQSANPNKVTFTIGSDIPFAPAQLRDLATIRVKVTGVVPSPAACGEFFTRLDSTSDTLVTNDALCDTPVTAGAQASANLQAPVCKVDADCGGAQCNQCTNVGTNNQCATKNVGGSCGPDNNLTDCVTPACVNNAGTGVCTQGQSIVVQGTACASDSNVCTDDQCNAGGGCVHLNNTQACNDGSQCTTNDACSNGSCVGGPAPNCNDGKVCTTDTCNPAVTGGCVHSANTASCDDGLFCTTGDVCADATCSGTRIDCGDRQDCTVDSCNEAAKQCVHTPNDGLCDDGDPCTSDNCSAQGCSHDQLPGGSDVFHRGPGYWSTHSGYEKKNSHNIGQMVIDAVGPLEVCGQTITTTSRHDSPYVEGLGLSSALEGLCVKDNGVQQRQLYRHLLTTALNCGMSGVDCDAITLKHAGVKFSDCNDLCAGNAPANVPSIGACVRSLSCFNNGGEMSGKQCVQNTNSCQQPVCNPAIGEECPPQTPASSPRACNEATMNDCTIDSCN